MFFCNGLDYFVKLQWHQTWFFAGLLSEVPFAPVSSSIVNS